MFVVPKKLFISQKRKQQLDTLDINITLINIHDSKPKLIVREERFLIYYARFRNDFLNSLEGLFKNETLVKGDTTALFLRIENALCNQIIRSCPGWVCASYFLCPRKNPCANGNDALFHASFRLQASERNITGLKCCFHGA